MGFRVQVCCVLDAVFGMLVFWLKVGSVAYWLNALGFRVEFQGKGVSRNKAKTLGVELRIGLSFGGAGLLSCLVR